MRQRIRHFPQHGSTAGKLLMNRFHPIRPEPVSILLILYNNQFEKPQKNLYQRSQFTEMILPCEIPQLDIPDVGSNHIYYFFSFQSIKSFRYKRYIQTACFKIIKTDKYLYNYCLLYFPRCTIS